MRSGVFHCGYCNFIESSLDGVQNHLKTVEHSAKKTSCQRRLMDYLPEIQESRHHEHFIKFMRMLHNN